MNEYEIIGILILLIICSITDIKTKQISLKICISFLMFGFGWKIMIEDMSLMDISLVNICFGTVPGIILYAVSILSRGGIGKGDAVLMGVIGMYIGIKNSIILFVSALLLIACFSIVLIILKKGNMKTKIPFVPFILIAFIIQAGFI